MDPTTSTLGIKTRLQFRLEPGCFGNNYSIRDVRFHHKEYGSITSKGLNTVVVEYAKQFAIVNHSTSNPATVENRSTNGAIRLLAESDASEPAWLLKKENVYGWNVKDGVNLFWRPGQSEGNFRLYKKDNGVEEPLATFIKKDEVDKHSFLDIEPAFWGVARTAECVLFAAVCLYGLIPAKVN